jgi:DNA-binding response OmpR family regulator
MPNGSRLSILLVEDDHDLLDALVGELRRAGHECEAADSGERALSAWRERTFDIVVTDLRMPGIDGVDLADELCRSELVPVIVITGFRQDYQCKLCRLPHLEVLEKPFTAKKLLDRVAIAVASPRTPSDNGAHAGQQLARRAP